MNKESDQKKPGEESPSAPSTDSEKQLPLKEGITKEDTQTDNAGKKTFLEGLQNNSDTE